MTTDSRNYPTSNSKMRRRIVFLTLVAYFALSLSFTPSTATAKPISHNNNQASNLASQASTKNHYHHQRKAHNNGGLLNRPSSSWTSPTTPFQGLHAINGSPGPVPQNSNRGASVKRLHKRAVDMKKPTTAAATAGRSGGKKGGAQMKKMDKSTARAKYTYSAYEAIVNSDSQMPVFLNQDHPMNSDDAMRKGKLTSPITPLAAGGEKRKKAGGVTPIDILRQTGTKRPTAAAAVSSISPSAEDEADEGERKMKAKAEMEGTSPARKTEAESEGMIPARHPNKMNNNSTNKLSSASRAVVAAAVEDGASTVKTLFDTVFLQEEQQPSRRTAVESATGTAIERKGEDSEDIKAIKETINAAAHAAVAAAAAAAVAVAGNSHHNTSSSSHHLEERDTAGILKQALEDIAHKIEEAATAAIALEIPSLTDHTLGSHSSAASREREAVLEGERLAPVFKNPQDTIIDDEGAVDLPAIANNNNHQDTTTASKTDEESSSTVTKQKPGPIFINDNEYTSHSSFEHSDTITTDEWRLIHNNDDDFDYMSQYIHHQPDNFPGSDSILFTGTVLQRTLASSFLLLSGLVMLLGLISYRMYARRRTTSPWAFLQYMTFGVFGSLFYDSAYLSNSTLNSYQTTSQASPSTTSSSTMKKGFGFGPNNTTTTWLRRGSLTRPITSSTDHNNHNIMSTPAEKEPLLPEPVVASSSSSAPSLFKKGGLNRTELRHTSTAHHHQMQIELALQQQQRREEEQQQQQAEMDYLQLSFMRRTSI